jgi:hypothetical protein
MGNLALAHIACRDLEAATAWLHDAIDEPDAGPGVDAPWACSRRIRYIVAIDRTRTFSSGVSALAGALRCGSSGVARAPSRSAVARAIPVNPDAARVGVPAATTCR